MILRLLIPWLAGILLLLLSVGGRADGINLIDCNSSFEVGLKGFSVDYAGLYADRETYVQPGVIDDTTAVHGRCSLRIQALNRGRYGFASRVYTLTPGKKYTFSFYAKADKPVVLPLIKITSNPGAHSVGLDGVANLTPEWQRYSFSGVLTAGERVHSYKNRYFVRGFFPQTPEAMIWIDAMQLEEGEMTDYKPARSAEIQISHSRTGHIFYVGETAPPATIDIFRMAPASGDTVSTVLLDNYTGAVVTQHVWNVPNDNAFATLAHPVPKLPRGSYKIRAALLREGVEQDFAEWIFAFITPFDPARAVPVADSFLGVHGGAGGGRYFQGWNHERDFWYDSVRPEWTYQLLRDLGIHWQRVDCLGAVHTCRETPGEIYAGHIEDWVGLARQYDIQIMATLGAGPERGPAWMASDRQSVMTGSTLFNLDGVRTYAAKLAQAAPGIQCWETFNEPNCYFSPEEFCDLNQAVFEAIRSVRPDATIIGGSATADLGADADTALSRYFELGFARYLDVVSVHGHYGPTPLHIVPVVAKAHAQGKALWDTELRVDSGSLYTGLTTMEIVSQIYGFGGERAPREHAIHSISVYMDGLANGIGRCFVHAWWQSGSIWFGNGPSWVEYDLSPRPIIPAVDAFNEFVDGGEPMGIIDLGGRNRCYMVSKNDRPVVFLQLEQELEAELALGIDQVEVFNLMGNPLQIKSESPGRIRLTLGHDPVYIVGRDMGLAEDLRAALLQADFKTTFFSAHGPRLGVDATGRPALICRVINEGAINGLTGVAVLTATPEKFSPDIHAATFSNLSLRADARLVFPLAIDRDATDRNTVSVSVQAGNRTEALSRTLRVLSSTQARAPVRVDASRDDWPDDLIPATVDTFDEVTLVIQGAPWSGPEDCSARVYSQWDQSNLYLLAVVQDDTVMMDPAIREKVVANPDLLYEADAVEFFFDVDLMRDFYMNRVNEDDFQLVFSPTLSDGTPGRISIPAGNTGLAREYYRWTPSDRIESASALLPDGYMIEIRIPFAVFGDPALPERKMIGFNFAVDDDDTEGYALQAYSSQRRIGRDLQMKWSGQGLNNPVTEFGVLIFRE